MSGVNLPSVSPQRQSRLLFAAVTAVVGVVVALAMAHVGGPNARYLPRNGLYVAAFAGAWLAGAFCAGAFGRAGALGWGIAFTGAVGMTFLGALIGAAILWQTRFFLSGPFLGVVAIIDAVESPAVLVLWGISMAGLHVLAKRLRAAGPFVWSGRKRAD